MITNYWTFLIILLTVRIWGVSKFRNLKQNKKKDSINQIEKIQKQKQQQQIFVSTQREHLMPILATLYWDLLGWVPISCNAIFGETLDIFTPQKSFFLSFFLSFFFPSFYLWVGNLLIIAGDAFSELALTHSSTISFHFLISVSYTHLTLPTIYSV